MWAPSLGAVFPCHPSSPKRLPRVVPVSEYRSSFDGGVKGRLSADDNEWLSKCKQPPGPPDHLSLCTGTSSWGAIPGGAPGPRLLPVCLRVLLGRETSVDARVGDAGLALTLAPRLRGTLRSPLPFRQQDP